MLFSRVKQYVLFFAVLGTAAVVYELQGWMAEAGTMTGTAVDIGGLNNFAKTVEDYAKGNVGKLVGVVMGVGGLGMAMTGRMGAGIGVLGSGLGVAFVPNMMGTVFDATNAAPLLAVAPVMQPVTMVGMVLAFLGQSVVGQAFLAAMYPVALLLKWVRDPVMWSALVVVAMSRGFWSVMAGRMRERLYVG